MNHQRMQWLAIAFPAVLVGVFEFFRHRWLEHALGTFGNLIGSLVVAVAVYGFIRYYAGAVARAEQELGRARAEAAVLAERQRIGREMHDSVAQTLFHVRIKLQELGDRTADPRAAGEVERLEGQVTAAYDQVRAAIADLKRHTITENPGEVLQRAAARAAADLGLAVEVRVSSLPELDDQDKEHLQAILTEALTNARRHGGATVVTVTGDRFSLVIADNGRGFDPARVPADRFGLMIMEERALMIGGRLQIDAAVGRGARILIHWEDEADGHPASDR